MCDSPAVELCTKSSGNTNERELVFHTEPSWGQREDGGGLEKNLQGEGGMWTCPLLRALTKQPRKEMPVGSALAKPGHLWPVAFSA